MEWSLTRTQCRPRQPHLVKSLKEQNIQGTASMMGAAAVDHSDGSTGPMTGEPLAMVFSSDC
jgi:hypothetical protein